ncbi:acetyltransferase [Vibrio paracholerae]|nr:acetyltransferase [Vibrio paracholerae]
MVSVVVFEFSVMRCQPLRRALVSLRKNHQKFTHRVLKIQPLSFKLYILAFGFWLLAFGFFLMPIW